ncbi:hypothetical protein BC830DRAFT_1143754 [Chytriomyces sp. MP71]|nr:hypothetical protein BC830DRAFT_1143754 [Chytriomyces sp. MP71]
MPSQTLIGRQMQPDTFFTRDISTHSHRFHFQNAQQAVQPHSPFKLFSNNDPSPLLPARLRPSTLPSPESRVLPCTGETASFFSVAGKIHPTLFQQPTRLPSYRHRLTWFPRGHRLTGALNQKDLPSKRHNWLTSNAPTTFSATIRGLRCAC